jgi:hypothetical protein
MSKAAIPSRNSSTIPEHENALPVDQDALSDGIQDPLHHGTILQKPDASRLLLYFMTIHFLLAFCELILVAPLIKLFEQSLCITYYDIHDPSVIDTGSGIPEFLCKIQEIQVPLATIRGWKSLFDTIPGKLKDLISYRNSDCDLVLIIAVPFGKLGDRYGRRKLLAVILLGVASSYCQIFLVCTSSQSVGSLQTCSTDLFKVLSLAHFHCDSYGYRQFYFCVVVVLTRQRPVCGLWSRSLSHLTQG